MIIFRPSHGLKTSKKTAKKELDEKNSLSLTFGDRNKKETKLKLE